MNNVLPLFPDLPPEPSNLACGACNGSGAVYHPLTVIEHHNTYFCPENHKIVETVVKTVCGGIDACPECAALAEAEYKGK